MILYIFIIIFIIIIINETYHTIKRQYERIKIFRLAEMRAKKIKRPLVVIGDPYNGKGTKFFNKFLDTYGCGDETIDLTGAQKCKNGIKSDLFEYLIKQKSNSKVFFISCVLEYIENIDKVIKELYRVAGSSINIFIVSVNRYCLTAYLYKDGSDKAKNIIKGPPYYDIITYKRI
jgi:hypothetical protein